MIAYKVVTEERESAYIGETTAIDEESRNRKKKYLIKYLKDKIVEAPKGTLGIFCFDSIKNAEKFLAFRGAMILEVKPLTKGKRITKIVPNICFFDDYYSCSESNELIEVCNPVPEGTICFDKVKVLD